MGDEKIIAQLLTKLDDLSGEEILQLEESGLPKLAEPYVQRIVDLLAAKKYAEIPQQAELTNNWTVEDLQEFAEGFLADSDLPYFDKFGVPCDFNPQYEYYQLNCFLYDDGTGFHVDYDLTTDGELNDLTLQLDFWFQPDNTLKVCFYDVHVM